jgi:hypothetical protein
MAQVIQLSHVTCKKEKEKNKQICIAHDHQRTSGGAQFIAGIGGVSRLGALVINRASPISANFNTKSCEVKKEIFRVMLKE